MNTLNSFKTHVFYYDLYDQSDEFNVTLGNKLVIAGALVAGPEGIMSSSAIYGMLHDGWAITNT